MSSRVLPWNGRSLPELLSLNRIDDATFESVTVRNNMNGNIYGGQLMGQSIAAASKTVDETPIESCFATYLKSGSIEQPIEYRIERIRDGRSYKNRRVRAFQLDEPIFELNCSFHAPEEGYAYQPEMASAPPPETLNSYKDIALKYRDQLDSVEVDRLTKTVEIEGRPVNERELIESQQSAERLVWIRAPSSANTSPSMQTAILGYAADFRLAGTSLLIQDYPRSERPFIVSLDLSIYFHAPVQMENWQLYEMKPTFMGNGTALCEGRIFSRSGKLISTVSQSSLQRIKR